MGTHKLFGQVPESDIANLVTDLANRVLSTDTRLSVKPYPPVTLTDAATIATNAALGTHFRVSIGASRNLGAPSNPTDGQVCTWEVTASGAFTLTPVTTAGGFAYGSDITALSAIASTKTDYIQAVYRQSVDRWRIIGYVKGY